MPEPTTRLRVGLVGCGDMGRMHLRYIRDDMPEFDTVSVCDFYPAAIEEIRSQFEIGVAYEDFESMYDTEDLDLVVVATQTRGHRVPTVAALARGIPVLCEKPIAIDLVEADEMVEAAAKSNSCLAINQQNHVSPAIRKAQELVRQGTIGEPVLIRGLNKGGRKSGNEFMEMGTHVTDQMLCLGGSVDWCAGTIYCGERLAGVDDIMEATAMSPKDRDSGLVMGERAVGYYGFGGGVLGEIQFLGYEAGYNPNYGMDVLGTEGQLSVRSADDASLWHLPRPMTGSPDDFGDWQRVELTDVSPGVRIATMYRELMQAHAKGVDPSASGDSGRTAFEMILGLYESHRASGQRISLPLSQRHHPLERWRSEDGVNHG